MKTGQVIAVALIAAAAWVATVAMLGANALILVIPAMLIVVVWIFGR